MILTLTQQHTLIHALRVATDAYRHDAETLRESLASLPPEHQDRVALKRLITQFEQQRTDADGLANLIENAEYVMVDAD